jgi:hypothetical protein
MLSDHDPITKNGRYGLNRPRKPLTPGKFQTDIQNDPLPRMSMAEAPDLEQSDQGLRIAGGAPAHSSPGVYAGPWRKPSDGSRRAALRQTCRESHKLAARRADQDRD